MLYCIHSNNLSICPYRHVPFVWNHYIQVCLSIHPSIQSAEILIFITHNLLCYKVFNISFQFFLNTHLKQTFIKIFAYYEYLNIQTHLINQIHIIKWIFFRQTFKDTRSFIHKKKPDRLYFLLRTYWILKLNSIVGNYCSPLFMIISHKYPMYDFSCTIITINCINI